MLLCHVFMLGTRSVPAVFSLIHSFPMVSPGGARAHRPQHTLEHVRLTVLPTEGGTTPSYGPPRTVDPVWQPMLDTLRTVSTELAGQGPDAASQLMESVKAFCATEAQFATPTYVNWNCHRDGSGTLQ